MLNQLRLWQLVDTDTNIPAEVTFERLAHGISFFLRAALESACPEREFDGGVVDTEDGPVVSFVVHR